MQARKKNLTSPLHFGCLFVHDGINPLFWVAFLMLFLLAFLVGIHHGIFLTIFFNDYLEKKIPIPFYDSFIWQLKERSTTLFHMYGGLFKEYVIFLLIKKHILETIK